MRWTSRPGFPETNRSCPAPVLADDDIGTSPSRPDLVPLRHENRDRAACGGDRLVPAIAPRRPHARCADDEDGAAAPLLVELTRHLVVAPLARADLDLREGNYLVRFAAGRIGNRTEHEVLTADEILERKAARVVGARHPPYLGAAGLALGNLVRREDVDDARLTPGRHGRQIDFPVGARDPMTIRCPEAGPAGAGRVATLPIGSRLLLQESCLGFVGSFVGDPVA